MFHDLFDQTLAPRKPAGRTGWTVAGSVVAHAVVLGLLFVLPILSALDSFVLRAADPLQFAMPATAVPVPPPPPRIGATVAPDINPSAAPPAPPLTPVTAEVPLPAAGGGTAAWGGIDTTGPIGVPGPVGSRGVVPLAPPPQAPRVPVRPGGDIQPPARTLYVAPVYPPIARTARIEGTVILEATIDELGLVRDVHVLRSIPLLDRAAIDAVSRWRYTPTRLNGSAVPILLTVTVTFTLK